MELKDYILYNVENYEFVSSKILVPTFIMISKFEFQLHCIKKQN